RARDIGDARSGSRNTPSTGNCVRCFYPYVCGERGSNNNPHARREVHRLSAPPRQPAGEMLDSGEELAVNLLTPVLRPFNPAPTSLSLKIPPRCRNGRLSKT